jgi:hypothetical protein
MECKDIVVELANAEIACSVKILYNAEKKQQGTKTEDITIHKH